MCGVVAALGDVDAADVFAGVRALAHRGPDAAGLAVRAGVMFGHARLAIQDLDARSNQPYEDGPVTVAYNGEVFNADELRAAVLAADPGRVWSTTGDTEVLAAALAVLGPDRALSLVDGMFAVAWADERRPGVLFVARDRHGEVPLHLHPYGVVASELKALTALGLDLAGVVDVPAGCWGAVDAGGVSWSRWHTQSCAPRQVELDEAAGLVRAALARAVQRRLVADVPVCALLSGGVDSAAITYELAQHVPDLVAYTARMDPKSRDLRCAREVADELGVTLVEVDVPVPSADDLAAVVRTIELPYKAQIEIGWACLHLAERIRADGFRVTYSGEGSDELWASYGFAYHGLKTADWHTYRRDLMAAQARKNFPRVNKAFMAYGVEARLPFCDPDLVDLALALPRTAVQAGKSRPKAVLQSAYLGALPDAVTRRPKVAFQDGLGLKQAITETVPEPLKFYRAEYRRMIGGSP